MAKILILDDDRYFLDILEAFLKPLNCLIIKVQDSLKLDKTLQENNPDLIISDIIMPDKEGLEVLLDIKKKYSLPVIMMSSNSKYLEYASKFGADDVILKPITEQQTLLSKVKKYI